MLCLYCFGFEYEVISDGRGEVCFAHRAREELRRENLIVTTTATKLGRGLTDVD